jgi:hypothetical protein
MHILDNESNIEMEDNAPSIQTHGGRMNTKKALKDIEMPILYEAIKGCSVTGCMNFFDEFRIGDISQLKGCPMTEVTLTLQDKP